MRYWIVFLSLFVAVRCWAFPENVRHGYLSCIACHVSPSGGGVLTPYGRSVSAELMSTWGTAKTAGILFSNNEDEKRNPSWLRANVFLRGVQTYRNSETAESAKFIPMQQDFEAGVEMDRWALVTDVGLRAKSATSQSANEFFSRRHYVIYRFNDNWSARAGKFMFAFGLNGPDHITATRRGLNWNQGMESYNAEVSYASERANSTLSIITDVPEEKNIKKDSGAAFTHNFLIREHSKLGFNLYYGQQNSFDRIVYGPSWIISFTDRLYLNSEFFGQSKKVRSTDLTENGYAGFHRLNYEVVKGLTPFIQFDRSFLDNKSAPTKFDSHGIGTRWLPYPHIELTGFVGRENAYGQRDADFAWLMAHLYL